MMNLTRWNSLLDSWQHDLGLALQNHPQPTTTSRRPIVDVWSDEDALYLIAELPGVAPEHMEIEVLGDELRISGNPEKPSGVPSQEWVRRERVTAPFERSFHLPQPIDPQQVEAKSGHGILEIRVAHPATDRPHQIPIQTQ